MTDTRDRSYVCAHREEDEFIYKMSGYEPAGSDVLLAFGWWLAVIGCVTGVAVFLLFSLAAFWPWAATVLLSGWGIGLSALSVASTVLTVVLLDRAQEGRS